MSKFHAKRTEVDGITFASKKEAARYGELKLMQRAREIESLVLQQRYRIEIDDILVCTYVADFSYLKDDVHGEPQLVVEDVKGFKTPVYRLKKKLMLAVHGIEIQEV